MTGLRTAIGRLITTRHRAIGKAAESRKKRGAASGRAPILRVRGDCRKLLSRCNPSSDERVSEVPRSLCPIQICRHG